LQRGNLRLGVRPDGAVSTAIGEGRTGNDLRRFVDDEVVGEARRPDAGGGILLGNLNQLAERAARLPNPIDVALHVRRVVDPVEGDEQLRQERVDGRHLIEHVSVGPETHRGLGLFELIEPDVVRGLRFGTELRVVERLAHLGRGGAKPCQLSILRRERHVVELAGLLAKERLLNWTKGELFLELGFEPGIDARRVVAGRWGGLRDDGCVSLRSHERQD
jgi:hypothetical protein